MDAGSEMNKAISDITGIALMECIEGDWYDFEPSTNWDDAMEAADRFNLFGILTVLGRDEWGAWTVMELDGPRLTEVSNSDSGPLAICRAILAISSRTDTRSCSYES